MIWLASRLALDIGVGRRQRCSEGLQLRQMPPHKLSESTPNGDPIAGAVQHAHDRLRRRVAVLQATPLDGV